MRCCAAQCRPPLPHRSSTYVSCEEKANQQHSTVSGRIGIRIANARTALHQPSVPQTPTDPPVRRTISTRIRTQGSDVCGCTCRAGGTGAWRLPLRQQDRRSRECASAACSPRPLRQRHARRTAPEPSHSAANAVERYNECERSICGFALRALPPGDRSTRRCLPCPAGSTAANVCLAEAKTATNAERHSRTHAVPLDSPLTVSGMTWRRPH